MSVISLSLSFFCLAATGPFFLLLCQHRSFAANTTLYKTIPELHLIISIFPPCTLSTKTTYYLLAVSSCLCFVGSSSYSSLFPQAFFRFHFTNPLFFSEQATPNIHVRESKGQQFVHKSKECDLRTGGH